MGTIAIVLADDDEIVRSGLRLLLESEPDFHVVGEAGDLDAAVRCAESLRPDVLLLDLWMHGRASVEAISAIRAASQGTSVVMLTSDDAVAPARDALQAGAAGYVLKRSERRQLARAIRAAATGTHYVEPGVGARLAVAPAPGPEPTDLTARERDVLGMLADGLTNSEMANRLKISVRTVEAHRARLQHKLGVFGRSNLVRYAREHGISSE